VSPIERHEGRDGEILQQRHAVYEAARKRNPNRWSGNTRDWSLPDVVYLNPEKEQVELAKTG